MSIAFAAVLAAGVSCADYTSTTYQPPVDQAHDFAPGLWTFSGSSLELLRFDAPRIDASGNRAADTKLLTPGDAAATRSSIAFDNDGTMWIADQSRSVLLGFTSGGAESGSFVSPAMTITAKEQSLALPTGIAFAGDGALWVANVGNGTIVRFDKSQLASTGSPIPSVTITGIVHPTGLAFDANGALWVSDYFANTVSRYLPGQLLTSGDKPPAITLESLVNPIGIAFDAANNMWVANSGNESVVAYRPPQRASSGSPVPFATLTSAQTLGIPSGLAFDLEGSLWIVGGSGLLTKFRLPEIAASGPAEPTLQVSLDGRSLFWGIAFWPRPVGFPLN